MLEHITILIVEDERIAAMHIQETLSNHGYTILDVVSEAEDAIEQTRIQRPDIILMDIILKSEMDGIEAAQIITEQWGTPIIFMTASSEPSTVQRAKKIQPYGYINKPIRPFDLYSTIETAVYRYTTQRQLNQTKQEKSDLQKQLIQNSKLAAIGEMTAGLAHEINQPLTAIYSFAQTIITHLERSEIRPEKINQYAQHICDSVQRSMDLIEQLRMFSRPSEKEKAPISINAVLQSAHFIFSRTRMIDHISIQLLEDPSNPSILGRFNNLEQVFLNLLNNSYDALKDKEDGQIIIRTAVDEANQVCNISVIDNGIGIPPDIIDNVLVPFITTKTRSEGTGLGLSISFGIINDHGGTFQISSPNQQGTTIEITLPLYQA